MSSVCVRESVTHICSCACVWLWASSVGVGGSDFIGRPYRLDTAAYWSALSIMPRNFVQKRVYEDRGREEGEGERRGEEREGERERECLELEAKLKTAAMADFLFHHFPPRPPPPPHRPSSVHVYIFIISVCLPAPVCVCVCAWMCMCVWWVCFISLMSLDRLSYYRSFCGCTLWYWETEMIMMLNVLDVHAAFSLDFELHYEACIKLHLWPIYDA